MVNVRRLSPTQRSVHTQRIPSAQDQSHPGVVTKGKVYIDPGSTKRQLADTREPKVHSLHSPGTRAVLIRSYAVRPALGAHPLPRINHIPERLRKAKFISTLDQQNGNWQIPASRKYTAFTVPGRELFQ